MIVVMWIAAWIGHACIWTALLNDLYGRDLPKKFLKPWRLFTGLMIVVMLPIGAWWLNQQPADPYARDLAAVVLMYYFVSCMYFGLTVFPIITVVRLLRKPPVALVRETTRTLDYWPTHGDALIGNGKWSWVPRVPLNCLFRVDYTELTLAMRQLPPAWDGLTILLLSDLHFHGTPSQLFFQNVFDELAKQPTPDLVVLAGDYLDNDEHMSWFEPLLGRLKWNEHGLAILGNHDEHHQPERSREELAKLGFRVVSNRWDEIAIRGEPCLVVGNEAPWFPHPPSLEKQPKSCFRLCVSHTPDQFYWGLRNRIDLMLCGHVHGGQIRLPIVSSIFVPSVYGRRFDMGVFGKDEMLMVVGRGLSGKEPLRFRCNPQVIRITLTSEKR